MKVEAEKPYFARAPQPSKPIEGKSFQLRFEIRQPLPDVIEMPSAWIEGGIDILRDKPVFNYRLHKFSGN